VREATPSEQISTKHGKCVQLIDVIELQSFIAVTWKVSVPWALKIPCCRREARSPLTFCCALPPSMWPLGSFLTRLSIMVKMVVLISIEDLVSVFINEASSVPVIQILSLIICFKFILRFFHLQVFNCLQLQYIVDSPKKETYLTFRKNELAYVCKINTTTLTNISLTRWQYVELSLLFGTWRVTKHNGPPTSSCNRYRIFTVLVWSPGARILDVRSCVASCPVFDRIDPVATWRRGSPTPIVRHRQQLTAIVTFYLHRIVAVNGPDRPSGLLSRARQLVWRSAETRSLDRRNSFVEITQRRERSRRLHRRGERQFAVSWDRPGDHPRRSDHPSGLLRAPPRVCRCKRRRRRHWRMGSYVPAARWRDDEMTSLKQNRKTRESVWYTTTTTTTTTHEVDTARAHAVRATAMRTDVSPTAHWDNAEGPPRSSYRWHLWL